MDNLLFLYLILKLFGKFWSGKPLHILLRMFNLSCHQVHGWDCTQFLVNFELTNKFVHDFDSLWSCGLKAYKVLEMMS